MQTDRVSFDAISAGKIAFELRIWGSYIKSYIYIYTHVYNVDLRSRKLSADYLHRSITCCARARVFIAYATRVFCRGLTRARVYWGQSALDRVSVAARLTDRVRTAAGKLRTTSENSWLLGWIDDADGFAILKDLASESISIFFFFF